LNHVVYWYGAREECNFYGFVAHKDLLTYQDGMDRGYFKVYEAVKNKNDENKKLTKSEQDKLLAMEEVRDDLSKRPVDRNRGVTGFPEVWDMLVWEDIDDLESSSSSSSEEEEMEDIDDDLDEEEPEPQRYARKKSYHDSNKLGGNKLSPMKQHAKKSIKVASQHRMNGNDRELSNGQLHRPSEPTRPATVTSQPTELITNDGKSSSSPRRCSSLLRFPFLSVYL
jgi:hypothetical protein